MPVVDHRAAFAAHGGHTTAGPSARFARTIAGSSRDIDSGGGAFHGHSSGHVMGEDGQLHHSKRHGLTTDDAINLSKSMRDLGGTHRSAQFAEALGEGAETREAGDPPGEGRRPSRGFGVAYGAASVKRPSQDAVQAEEIIGDSIRSIGLSGRSISAGEGAWLVKECDDRRRSSRGIVGTLSQSLRLEKKDSERLAPDLEEEDVILAASVRPIAKGEVGKSVHFSTVDVHFHPTVLGVNPFVTSGPPLELAWDEEPSATEANIPIDTYEDERASQRRSEWDLALSRGERESRLLEAGCTREEIAAAVRDTVRIKGQRANTVMNIKMAGVEEFVEGVTHNGTQLVGLRRNSTWLYNDWKNGSSNRRYKAYLEPKRGSIRDMFFLESPTSSGHMQSRFHLMKKEVKRSLSELLVPEPSRHYEGQFGITTTSIDKRVSLTDRTQDSHGVWPFAVVKIVYPNSPADEAGLKRGDRLIKVGNITALNNDHCKAIPALGQAAAIRERSIGMVVEDSKGERRDVTIRPRKWEGRGYFGFLFGELNRQ
ncbi:hypothetical protein ACHAXT_006271 [Thalassiosira profunda]